MKNHREWGWMHSFENASSYDSFFCPSTLNLKKEECFSTNVLKLKLGWRHISFTLKRDSLHPKKKTITTTTATINNLRPNDISIDVQNLSTEYF